MSDADSDSSYDTDSDSSSSAPESRRRSTHLEAPSDDEESGCKARCKECCDLMCCLLFVPNIFIGILRRLRLAARWVREKMYGDPEEINYEERGHSKVLFCCTKRVSELRFNICNNVFCNIKDIVVDSLLLLKWLGGIDVMGPLDAYARKETKDLDPWSYPKREWEAYLLLSFLAMASISSMILSTKTRGRGCSWKIIFHAVGLGTMIESIEARGDAIEWNMMRYVKPFQWSDIIFELAPSAMLTLYVKFDDSTTGRDHFVSLETTSLISSFVTIGLGFAGLVQNSGKQTDHMAGGPGGFKRTMCAMVVMLFDIMFRSITFVLLWHSLPEYVESIADFGFEIEGWMVFIAIFVFHFCLEIVFVLLNKKYFKPKGFVILLLSWVGVFNGALLYFSRRWQSSKPRAKKTKHKRTECVFWLRWAVQWVILLVCYFVVADCSLGKPFGPTGCSINGSWFWTGVLAGLLLPTLFYLKPPCTPVHNVSPWSKRRMEEFAEERRERKASKNPPMTRIEMIQSQSDMVSHTRHSSYEIPRKFTETEFVSEDEPKPNFEKLRDAE